MIRLQDQTTFRPQQADVPLTQCACEYCGPNCVFHRVTPAMRAVRHGHDASVAVTDGTRLWLNLADETHPPEHPLHWAPPTITRAARADLVRAIQAAASVHIVPITGVCDCGFIVEVITGSPLADLNTEPAWHREAGVAHRLPPLSMMSWVDFAGRAAGLAEGLHALHQCGIVHGDPFPFNAMLTAAGAAVWVDLNDVLPATPHLVALDVWAFVTFTLFPSISKLPQWHPVAVADLGRELEGLPLGELLPMLAGRLRVAAADSAGVVPASGERVITTAWHERADELGEVARRQTPLALQVYYRAYEWNAEAAHQRARYLAAEQARHQLVEREIHRTVGLQQQRRLEELERWSAELEGARHWLEDQCATLRQTADQKAQFAQEQQQWAQTLDQARRWLSEQVNNWRQAAVKRDEIIQEQRAWMATLEKGKSWLEQDRNRWQQLAEERGRALREIREQSSAVPKAT